jgi:hypothetical protein
MTVQCGISCDTLFSKHLYPQYINIKIIEVEEQQPYLENVFFDVT